MAEVVSNVAVMETVARHAEYLFEDHRKSIFRRTDRLFAAMMPIQWLAAIAAAYWITPRTWAGQYSQVHFHVWVAIWLGGVITLFPAALGWFRAGRNVDALRHRNRSDACVGAPHSLDGWAHRDSLSCFWIVGDSGRLPRLARSNSGHSCGCDGSFSARSLLAAIRVRCAHNQLLAMD